MSLTLRNILLVMTCALAAAAGGWAGRTFYFPEQVQLLRELREISTIIFGIMGAWSAIVYPDELKRTLNIISAMRVDDDRLQNFRTLMASLLVSAGILGIVLTMQFAAPILGRIPWVAAHSIYFRSASFAIGCSLAVLQVWTLLLVLIPLNSADADIRAVQEAKERYKEGPQGKIGTRKQKPASADTGDGEQ